MDVSGQLHFLVALPSGERAPGTHRIGGYVGLRADLIAVAKWKDLRILPKAGFGVLVSECLS